MDKLYIVIPCYNEAENIIDVIDDWYKVLKGKNDASRLVIIDDGSKDNTKEIVEKIKGKYPKLVFLTKKNEGHGATILYGYNYAIKNGADYIFQTDSDGQTLPSEFTEFWNERKKYDMLIGYRKGRKDGISRIFVTRTLRLIILAIFHVFVKDANTPYRLMNAKVLKEYIGLVPSKYHLSNVIISVIYRKFNLKVKYFDITFRERQGGKNSINMKKINKIGINALKEFRDINKSINKKRLEKRNEKK